MGRLIYDEIQRYPYTVFIKSLRGEANARVPLVLPRSSVTIYYSPEAWWNFARVEGYDPHGDFSSDSVLIHELFHAVTGMRGAVDLRGGVRLDRHNIANLEEFGAILVTNLYFSIVGRDHSLRGSH